MSTEVPPATTESPPKKAPLLRVWVLAAILGAAALAAWLTWPYESEISPFQLSRADGKSRFYATTYPKTQLPPNSSVRQRLFWTWVQLQRRFAKRNPAAYVFPPGSVRPCSIHGLLNQCMEVSGTQYLIGVEIAGSVQFGNTTRLNGVQWVTAFEQTLETNSPVLCYDFGKKRNFQDTLLLIRDKPRVVKIVPRSKLAAYQQAGLVNPRWAEPPASP